MTPALSQALTRMASALPAVSYKFVPKSVQQNSRWREWILRTASSSSRFQSLLRLWCKHDILFWINTFVWALDTREQQGTTSPFVTFECQDEAVLAMVHAIHPKPGGKQHDLMMLKSRDMGATWICAMVFLWFLLFHHDRLEFFCMSYKEDLVDGGGKSIFGKIDFALEHMPPWLLPTLKRTNMLLQNLATGSTIEGESTTSRSGVGGRYAAMFFDEFQLVDEAESLYTKSAACSNSRIFNGTPMGKGNCFYRLTQDENIKKVRLHWSQHAWKAKGLSVRPDGKATSPWYVQACKRLGNNKQAIAENLDIDFQASGWQYFDPPEIRRLVDLYARAPVKIGTVIARDKFQESPAAHMSIWCKLLENGLPPKGRYGIGCDCSSGHGGKMSTPSVASVVNLDTGEKVGELADPFLRPDIFARLVARIGFFFYTALVIWEKAGPGVPFGRALVEEEKYPKFYLAKKSEQTLSPELTDNPGWHPTADSNLQLLEFYRTALSAGTFLNPSKAALEETLNFIYDGRSVSHALKLVKDDPSGAKANHGDRVTADALANLLVKEDGAVQRMMKIKDDGTQTMLDPPVGSMAWRDKMEEAWADDDGWGRD